MAASVVVEDSDVFGKRRVKMAKITLDSAYAADGEAVAPSDFGLVTIDHLVVTIRSIGATTGNVAFAAYNPTTGKILVYDETHSQVTTADDLSTLVLSALVIGV